MFAAADHDAAVLSEELGAPAAGLFCNGEIGPVGGKNFLHGFTATMALFGDAPTRYERCRDVDTSSRRHVHIHRSEQLR